MKLRPSGESGPIATSFRAFANYYNDEAWTWEHMALTRARVVSATGSKFQSDLETEIQRILLQPRDKNKLLQDVSEMRNRIASQKPAQDHWNLKYARGGILDIEFIAQYLVLQYAGEAPQILANNTYDLLKNLTRCGYLESPAHSCLVEALTLFQALQGILMITIEGEITSLQVKYFSNSLQNLLAWVGSCPDFKSLDLRVKNLAFGVNTIFKEIIDFPAAKIY